jgi:enoyl-CoA hydratase/carnithine racemase
MHRQNKVKLYFYFCPVNIIHFKFISKSTRLTMDLQKRDIWERTGGIGVLSLYSSHQNYLNEPEFIKQELLEELFGEPGLKGVIIKGSGRHFSAGADMDKLRQLAKDESMLEKKISAGKELIRIIENAHIPVIAEISGVCFGGGLEIALACHIRICSDNALFAFPEVNYGIMPGLGGTITLSKLIGAGRSAEIILSGDMVDAQKALGLKLADYIVPFKELHAFTLDFLDKMTAGRDIEVIHSVMQSIHNSQTMELERALEEETKLFCALAVKNMQE